MSDRKKKRGGFQLTHSRGVRQPLPVVPTTENNFNSRTHVECDPTVLLAPSRSNHFNSRTHVECDLNATSVNLDDIISTHALTWSATAAAELVTDGFENFNSRTHVECDPVGLLYVLAEADFNSRTHVECDISDTIPNVSGLDFNSRTHVECDANSEDQSATSFISTHALTWSATDGVVECDDYVKISTHALTWSATARRIHGAANREFQLTHSRGVRQFRHVLRTSPHTFQLTHSRGVRRAYLYPDLISIVDFNSRTHVECDIVPVFHVAQIFHFNSRTHVECDIQQHGNC